MINRLARIIRKYTGQKVSCEFEVLSAVEAAALSKNLPIYSISKRVIKSLGIKPFFSIGNTDGDVPLAQGIPTITLGASNGFGTHSFDEKLEKKTYLKGVGQVIDVILALDRELKR